MNAPNQWYQDEDLDDEPEFQVHSRRDVETQTKPKRMSTQNKSRNSSVNGMHRRRNKRFAW
jgi:hypothetical protein